MQIYANANHGKLPQHPAHMDHHFLYVLPRLTAEVIAPAGSSRHVVYCPSGDLSPDNAHWGSNASGGGICSTGYHWFIQRHDAGPPELFPPNRYHASFGNVADPATAELAADLVISHRGKFAGLSGGMVLPDGLINADRTSHLRSNNQADGGNILYLDGHVAWRAFKDMKIRGGPNDVWY